MYFYLNRSLGIVLYELCTQRHPFNEIGLIRVMWQIVNKPCFKLPAYYSKDFQNLLDRLIN